MAETTTTTQVPAVPEPYSSAVKLYDLAAGMVSGDLRDALTAALAQLHAYASLRAAINSVIVDADAGELRTPVDIVRELRAALDAGREG